MDKACSSRGLPGALEPIKHRGADFYRHTHWRWCSAISIILSGEQEHCDSVPSSHVRIKVKTAVRPGTLPLSWTGGSMECFAQLTCDPMLNIALVLAIQPMYCLPDFGWLGLGLTEPDVSSSDLAAVRAR